MNLNQGRTFSRVVKALAIARGDVLSAVGFAEGQNWADVHSVVRSIRAAAVTPLGTDDVVAPTPAQTDFSAFVRPRTVLGRLADHGLRRVPARTRLVTATGGTSASWPGERNPVPISKAAFSGEIVEPRPVTAVCVQTVELIRSSDPASEQVLGRDLAAACVTAADQALLDVNNAGVANGKPQAITHAGFKIHSSGATLAAIDSDLQGLIQALSDAGSNLVNAVFVTRPRTALYLSALRGSGGALAHPSVSVLGGMLLGLPLLVSSASPSGAGSPAEDGTIACLDPSEIVAVDDDNATVEISSQASISMVDNPASPSTLVSMYQTNAVAMKCVRFMNWRMVRPNMCITLDQLVY